MLFTQGDKTGKKLVRQIPTQRTLNRKIRPRERRRMESEKSTDVNCGMQLPTIKCPKCMRVWLAPGIMHGDTYKCRSCGFNFVVRKLSDNIAQPSDEVDLSETGRFE